ncbi:cytoplasmic protein, partial [Bacillus cereus]|nr:cytoplasmic protein [Bacillus cereus]
MEATYKTKDVTNKTGIPKHIVRKYSQLLEEHGYMISIRAVAGFYKIDDLKLFNYIHDIAATLLEDLSETIPFILKEKEAPPVPVI